MDKPMLRFAAMYAAGAMASMQMRCVEGKDRGTTFPDAKRAQFHSAPKLPTEKKVQPSTETPSEKKKRYASLRRRFK